MRSNFQRLFVYQSNEVKTLLQVIMMRLRKLIQLLLVTTLFLGVVAMGSASGCSDDAVQGGTPALHHCLVHCGCHTPGFVPGAVTSVSVVRSQRFLPDLDSFKPRLLTVDIFNPPKA